MHYIYFLKIKFPEEERRTADDGELLRGIVRVSDRTILKSPTISFYNYSDDYDDDCGW